MTKEDLYKLEATAVPKLIAEIRRLREVLGWYADEYNWKYPDDGYDRTVGPDDVGLNCSIIGNDYGKRARKALGVEV